MTTGPLSSVSAPGSIPDVLIVGAGVTGASLAFHLSRRGDQRVTVIDQGWVGGGMSSRSSALVRMHYTFSGEVQLAVRSDQMFDTWEELTGAPSPIRRTGFVQIVTPGDEAILRANVQMQRSLGVEAELLTTQQVAEVAAGFALDDVQLAAWEPHGGYGDGSVVAGDLLHAARARGVTYRPTTAATRLLARDDRIVGVETATGERLEAGTVVVATGIWSPALLATVGFEAPIETELHHVLSLRHPPGGGSAVACIDSATATYFRPDAQGAATLVGTFVGPRGVDAAVEPPGPTLEESAEVVAAVGRRVPALLQAGIAGATNGIYDVTPDSRPLLGPCPEKRGLFLAIGFSGQGFKISPAVGEAMAALVCGEQPPIDLHAFRPSRFAEGQPIRPDHPYSDG